MFTAASLAAQSPVCSGPIGASLQHVSEVICSTGGTAAFLRHPPMGRFAVDVGGALTALLSGAFPTFETTDLLQDREATGRSLAAITRATVAMAARRGDTVGARALLDFGKGDLQAGQWVFSVFVPLSVVTVLVLKS